jgi:hypothetical protein
MQLSVSATPGLNHPEDYQQWVAQPEAPADCAIGDDRRILWRHQRVSVGTELKEEEPRYPRSAQWRVPRAVSPPKLKPDGFPNGRIVRPSTVARSRRARSSTVAFNFRFPAFPAMSTAVAASKCHCSLLFYNTWVDAAGVGALPDYTPSGQRLATEGYAPAGGANRDEMPRTAAHGGLEETNLLGNVY